MSPIARFRDRPVDAVVAAGFLAIALVLGGGGTPAPGPEMLLELLAVLTLVSWWVVRGRALQARQVGRSGALAAAVIVLVALLPTVQLVPLPPSWCTSLPQREAVLASLALVGAGDEWRPWSIAPARTLAALLSLGPPLLVLAMAAALDRAGLRVVLGAIVGVALAAALLGALQIAAGGGEFHLYSETHRGWVTGFHANRNAAADGFLIAILAAAALLAMRLPARSREGEGQPGARSRRGQFVVFLILAEALFVVATLLTGSRTGIALLLPVAAIHLAMIAPLLGGLMHNRRRILLPAVFAASVLAAAGAFLLARYNTAMGTVIARFTGAEDQFRPELWEDVRFAIAQYWPFGSGLGTFVEAVLPAERLEVVDPSMPNRAHNDFLELALEGGVFGLLLLAVISGLCLWGFVRAWRSGDRERALFGLGVLIVVALHSLVDYPLRNMAISCLAGLAAGVLCMPVRHDSRVARRILDNGVSTA